MNIKSWTFNKTVALLLSVALFVASLFTVLYTVDHENVSFRGYEAFLLGWMDLSGSGIAWIANPLSVIALLLFLFNKLKASFITGFTAILFALGFILYENYFGPESTTAHISIGPSYFLWMASILNICVVAIYLIQWRKRKLNTY